MKDNGIAVLSIQETHILGCPYYEHNGFLVILSGSEGKDREHAGTGFIVAPWVRKSVQSFTQLNERLCNVKMRFPGGLISIISAYSPPNYDQNLEYRMDFYHQLREFTTKCKTHGPTYVLGDLNARIFYRCQGEEGVLGALRATMTATSATTASAAATASHTAVPPKSGKGGKQGE